VFLSDFAAQNLESQVPPVKCPSLYSSFHLPILTPHLAFKVYEQHTTSEEMIPTVFEARREFRELKKGG
jgi:hypothetical protein